MKRNAALSATLPGTRHRPPPTATSLLHGSVAWPAATAWRAAVASLPLLLCIGAPPLAAQELPPEIQVDRYMVQADRQIRDEEFAAALRTLDRVQELYETHEIVIPASFWIKRAEVAMGAGRHVTAMESSSRYLEVAGRGGEQYDEALELLDRAFAQACTAEEMTETLEALKACLAFGADPNEPDASGRTPLHWAGQREDPGIAAALVEAGADSATAAVERAEAERVPEGPVCTGDYSLDSCWMELADRPGCYLWNAAPQDDETVTWSGECSNGLAQGLGRTTWYQNHEVSQTWEARSVDGRADGWAVGRGFGDDAFQTEGCYVNGERHGRWTQRLTESLSSGRYWEWTFSFSADERIVANMESDDVDSYLRVSRDDGTEIASDDDGGSGVNARLEFRVPVTGQYKIRASAFDDDDSGPFVLWVGDRDPGTMNPGANCRPR